MFRFGLGINRDDDRYLRLNVLHSDVRPFFFASILLSLTAGIFVISAISAPSLLWVTSSGVAIDDTPERSFKMTLWEICLDYETDALESKTECKPLKRAVQLRYNGSSESRLLAEFDCTEADCNEFFDILSACKAFTVIIILTSVVATVSLITIPIYKTAPSFSIVLIMMSTVFVVIVAILGFVIRNSFFGIVDGNNKGLEWSKELGDAYFLTVAGILTLPLSIYLLGRVIQKYFKPPPGSTRAREQAEELRERRRQTALAAVSVDDLTHQDPESGYGDQREPIDEEDEDDDEYLGAEAVDDVGYDDSDGGSEDYSDDDDDDDDDDRA